MVEALEADLLAAGGNHAAAAAHYRDAMKRFPLQPSASPTGWQTNSSRQVDLRRADMLRKDIVSAPDDHRCWGLLARPSSPRQSRRAASGSAEVYRLQGKPARGGRTARTL